MKKLPTILTLCFALNLLLTCCKQGPEVNTNTTNNQAEDSEEWLVPNINELDGHRIALITGTIHDDFVQTHYPHSEIIRMGNFTDILMALESDQCDFIVMDSAVFPDMQALHPDLRNLGKLFEDSVSVAFHPSAVGLCYLFNHLLEELHETGEFDRMDRRWFGKNRTGEMPHFNIPTNGKPLRVGIDGHTPHNCEIEGEQYGGYEIELCYRLAEKMQCPIKFHIINFGSLIPALQAQKIDLAISSFVATEERKKKVLFSNPYDFSIICAVTKVKNESTTDGKSLTKKINHSLKQNLLVEKRWKVVGKGLLITLLISIPSIVFGLLLGAGVCWMLLCRRKILSKTAIIYTDILRNVPILVVLMFLFYVVFAGSNITAIWVAIIAFSLHFSALTSIVYKAGIEQVSEGQYWAGLAMGFSKTSSFFNFVFPQALRNTLPVLKNCAVSLIKNTSIVGYIAIIDLTKSSDIIRSRTFDAFFPLIVISVIYFILAWLLGKGIGAISKKL